ncbi:hypothetical protein HPB50_026781 [Hyalomma asiaticum]|uniref:Uncharacterized protein n=1 Tax=Hyalomma asiaticum TaxID=266040 RepID=A0ACB7SW21_HYAAI|nr:hypothetical protein HPB50_026781 [Hyalomma asiaticum]
MTECQQHALQPEGSGQRMTPMSSVTLVGTTEWVMWSTSPYKPPPKQPPVILLATMPAGNQQYRAGTPGALPFDTEQEVPSAAIEPSGPGPTPNGLLY